MLVKNFAVWITFAFFGLCDSAFVDNLPKCELKDNECLRHLYNTVIRDIGKTGVPELGIPPVDPIHLKDETVSVLDTVNITLVEGVAKGIKDCVFQKFSINITEERGNQENKCDITIKGHYKLSGGGPLVQLLLGDNAISGEGNGKVSIENLVLKFDFPFYAQKRDGEIYIKCLYDLIKYDYEILGKVSFFADNVYLGKQELSKPLISFLNSNYRLIMSAFGQPFIDKAVSIYFKYAGYFFDSVPTRHYIIDDLTPYAKP